MVLSEQADKLGQKLFKAALMDGELALRLLPGPKAEMALLKTLVHERIWGSLSSVFMNVAQVALMFLGMRGFCVCAKTTAMKRGVIASDFIFVE
jgi:hypothetical protein